MRIGGGNAANYYSGDIQHVAIWERELSDAEVLSVFLVGAPDTFSQSVLFPNNDGSRNAGNGGTSSNLVESESSTSNSSSESDNMILIIILTIIAVVLIVAVTILVILFIRRRRNTYRSRRSSSLDLKGVSKVQGVQENEMLLDSIRTPLKESKATHTHAPTISRTITFSDEPLNTFSDDGDVEGQTSGRKPRFTRKGSRIHVKFQEDK